MRCAIPLFSLMRLAGVTFTMMTVDKSRDRVRSMFGQIAPQYDRMNHLLSFQVDRYWRWRTVRKVRPAGNDPVLDVCCGTGDLALAYHRVTAGRVRVVATDFCPEMLEIGERKKRNAGIDSQLQFMQADTEELPFSNNTFQIVSVAFGLRNVSDTDRGLGEMVRVCMESGRVAILEFSMPQRQPIQGIYRWYFRNVLPKIGQWLARNELDAYNYLPESVGDFPSGQALADRMTQAGLGEVKIYPLTFGVATLYVGTK